MAEPVVVVGQRYKVTTSYQPAHGDEIILAPGHIISVLHSYDDGWVLGKNEVTLETGLLPGNFLAPLDAPEPSSTSQHEKKVADKRKSSMQAPLSVEHEPAEEKPVNGAESNAPHEVAAIKVPDFPSGLAAGPLRAPSIGSKPSRAEQEDARRKLRDTTTRRGSRSKVPSNIGVLKIAVVGDSGIGKSSLIKLFLGSTEVVDSTSPKPIESYTALPILQTMASTIPDSHLLVGEEKLNLTFLEPPGFGSFTDAMRIIRPTADYNILQFQRTDRVFVRDKPVPSGTIVKFLNAGTGAHTHVDICLYAVLHRLKAVDLEFLRQLAPSVSIVPIIVKSDSLSSAEVFALKASILEELWRAGIEVYGFGLSHAELLQIAQAGVSGAVPYAISASKVAPAAGATDIDDVFHGVVNEFDSLKDNILYNYIGELRQRTSEKFMNWRSTNLP
ncbi:hypothetical protein SpCBS45565_g03226 [Spizellomyces sp. 'palustris']|nr:hypothetical protein SpCBS45565_g03226 [Spizellomyces sp. 'palustris']